MRGPNRTAPLKFDHPGLATSATRDGDRLVIQNDIGANDAHVLVLSVGLCDVTLPGLIRLTGNPRLAWDTYGRLISDFGEIVAGAPSDAFERGLAAATENASERRLDFEQARTLARRSLAVCAEAAGSPFPQDPREQLERAILAT